MLMLLQLLGRRHVEPLRSDLCPVLRPCARSVHNMTVAVSERVHTQHPQSACRLARALT